MTQPIDYTNIIENLVIFCAGGAIVWVLKSVLKATKDVNALFRKVRKLYKFVHKDEWEQHWND